MAFPIPQPTVRERAADGVGQAKTLDRAIGEIRIQESGGAGIEQASGGLIQFYCHVGGDYKNLKSSVTAEKGRYYHVVGVYDKAAQQTRIYVDGRPAGEMEAKGSFGFPSNTDAHWIAIGGDCNGSGNAQFSLNGDVVIARMYGKALTRDEAYLLYKGIKAEP